MCRLIAAMFFVAGLIGATPDLRVAVTIDDLPVAQSGESACAADRLMPLTEKLLSPLRAAHVPLTAFVIGGNCPGLKADERRAALEMWMAAGAEIGNHTYSHRSLNSVSLADYLQDIVRAEPVLRAATGGQRLRYFRSPMLQTGADAAKKEGLQKFLAEHGYRQAPVTFDNSDWMFAYVYANGLERDPALARRAREEYIPYMESVIAFFEKRSVEVVGREFPQVLLMHANRLNSETMPDLLAMLRRRGYRFVSLEEALQDAAYSLPEHYVGRNGFSWIHRWSQTKGMANRGEPDEPAWLREAYERMNQGK